MGLPVILGLLLLKKVSAGSLYVWGSRYGWPRLYRRCLEYNRKYTPASQRAAVTALIKTCFVMPSQIGNVLSSSPVGVMLMRVIEQEKDRPVVVAAGKFLERVTPEWLAQFAAEAAKAAVPPPPRGSAGSAAPPKRPLQ